MCKGKEGDHSFSRSWYKTKGCEFFVKRKGLESGMIQQGAIFTVTKGSRYYNIKKGWQGSVLSVAHLGKDYGYNVSVLIWVDGRKIELRVTNKNRLNDDVVRLLGPDPTHRIEVRANESRT